MKLGTVLLGVSTLATVTLLLKKSHAESEDMFLQGHPYVLQFSLMAGGPIDEPTALGVALAAMGWQPIGPPVRAPSAFQDWIVSAMRTGPTVSRQSPTPGIVIKGSAQQ